MLAWRLVYAGGFKPFNVRLQVFLSKAGIASRRAAVDIIKSGRVIVNGRRLSEPSYRIDPERDRVFFNDKRVMPLRKLYVMMNKPKGVTSTKKDRFAEKTVIDLLPSELRYLNPVGRLDKYTTGLMLLTNDGELINRLTHPSFNIDKSYEARLDRHLQKQDKFKIEKGIKLDGKYTAPCNISFKKGNLIEIVLHEGRKRQVRRVFAVSGYKVLELKRLRESFLKLGQLKEGEWRYLTNKEVAQLGGVL